MSDTELIQRSEDWFAARCGSLGASAVHEAVAKTKSGFAASRANRMATLILERLTGKPAETYQSTAMAYGTEMEPEARAYYVFQTDSDVMECGLFRHPKLKGTHASPDGLIGSDGVLEIKVPQPAAHLETLLTEKIPDRYLTQMLWQMQCSQRSWADYVSYQPSFPAHMKMWVKRVAKDDRRIAELETDVKSFLEELDKKVAELAQRYPTPIEVAA